MKRVSSLVSLGLVLVVMLTSFLSVSVAPITAQDDETSGPGFVNHNGQDLWLNGINLAWINFARDLSDFNEQSFIATLDELADANGNTLRWWLHTNGSTSPLYGEDGKVTGLEEGEIETLRRALDLAYERGILILPVLWSHDMMNVVEGIPTEFNQLMIEDPAYTQAYIDNVLTPMVTALKGHPAIVGWEIFNEPEGTTSEFGWTAARTEMPYIQQFTNLLAGAIRRADPAVKITTGVWSMRALTDVNGFTNYYTDERLIEAGGDPDGTLDFYTVHYYPQHMDESVSPFHNPYSYWELDKPLVIGEFPAAGIRNLGLGYLPRRSFPNMPRVMEYLYENGYAGGLGWTVNGGNEFGGLVDMAAGLHFVNRIDGGEHIAVNIGDIDRLPQIVAPIENLIVSNEETSAQVANLNEVFLDEEDGTNLTYELTGNSAPDKVNVAIEDGIVTLTFAEGALGATTLEITATDTGGNYSREQFVVQITDPDLGNVALGKTAISSTNESPAYTPDLATDGLDNTRWASVYEDGQTFIVDLDGVFTINQVLLRWETAFGKSYEIQVWDGAAWQTVFSEAESDGQIDEATFADPITARFVKLNGIERGTQWGFSLWEFEVYGARAEGQEDSPVASVPPDFVVADEGGGEEAVVSASSQLFSFEGDIQGWVIADFWAGGTALEVSDANATDGSGALKLTVSTTGTEWQEGGAFVDFAEGQDWSASTSLTVDVFVPAEAENFIAQVFVKTGPEWTWANTADTPLVAGEWNSITADLSTLGAIEEVHEVGVKVGSGATAFTGDFFIDNLALVTVEEPAGAPAAPVAGESSQLFSFEGDVQGWVIADFWAGGTALEASDANATDGSGALKLTVSTTGTEWQEGGAFVDFAEGQDWSSFISLTVDVFVPAEAENFIAQVFVKTGPEWTWANTADTPLVAGEWNTLTADLSTLGAIEEVHEVGVKVGSGSTAFTGDFFIDNLALVAAAESAPAGEEATAGEGVLLFSFEGDVESWVIADFWAGGTALEASDANTTEGTGALKLTVSTTGTEWQEGGAFVDFPEGVDWSAASAVTVDVFVPAEAENFIAQVFVKTGAEWTWANTPDTALVAGEWNTIVADLSTLGTINEVHEVGVKVGSGATAFTGDFFIDNVTLIPAAE